MLSHSLQVYLCSSGLDLYYFFRQKLIRRVIKQFIHSLKILLDEIINRLYPKVYLKLVFNTHLKANTYNSRRLLVK